MILCLSSAVVGKADGGVEFVLQIERDSRRVANTTATTGGQTLSRTTPPSSSDNFVFVHRLPLLFYQQSMPNVSDHMNNEGTASELLDASGDGRALKRRRRESEDRQRREIGLMRQSDGANAQSFVGSSSGIHFVRSVYHALAKSRVQAPPQTPDHSVVPGEEDMLDGAVPYSSKDLWSTDEIQDFSEGHSDFDFEDLQTWSVSYFENWHTAYPFISAPTILEFLEQQVRPATLLGLCKQRSPSFTIIRSIMSISLADRRQSESSSRKPVPADLVFTSFKEAMKSVQDMLFLPSSLDALQAVVAVQLFLVSMLRLNGASRLGGMVVRMAYQLGLHRCPTRYTGFSTEQTELRRRLFWSIYCIDRYLCQSLGLPLSIRDDDVDVCHFDEEKHVSDGHPRTTMDVRLKTLNFLARHASMKGQIMELRNKSIHQRTTNRDLATLIGAKIDKFGNDIQYVIDAFERDDLDRFTILHETVLLVSQHELIISLNRPLLALEKHTPEYAAALQTCIRASRAVIAILHQYLHTQTIRRSPSTCGIPLLWPSLTWCVWISSFIVLHAALEGEMPKCVARRLADDSVEILKHLALRGSVWPNVCAVAINDLFLRLLLDSTVATPQSPSIGTDQPDQGDDIYHPRAAGSNVLHRSVTDRQNDRHPGVESRTLNATNDLTNPALDTTESFVPAFDPQSCIPWLFGLDAAATTTDNIFEQFDIPFWMGDDQYTSLLDFDL